MAGRKSLEVLTEHTFRERESAMRNCCKKSNIGKKAVVIQSVLAGVEHMRNHCFALTLHQLWTSHLTVV